MACRKKFILAPETADESGNDLEVGHFVEVRTDKIGAETQAGEKGDVSDEDAASEDSTECSSEDSKDDSDEDVEFSASSAISEPTADAPKPKDIQDRNDSKENPSVENPTERMGRIERTLADISTVLARMQSCDRRDERPSSSHLQTDTSWSAPIVATSSEGTPSSIRWDNIKPFPSGVPANKMWEEWNRYIINFEIAASLSNANDPAKRTQLLFLSMGPALQEIVLAAKLRPSLENGNCYNVFISNIQNYFRAMTDTAAEHEAFSRMKQEKGETAVAFHARLMCKVRLCNYSAEDQDRFVRAQLLKGLRNKEIAKSGRIYGHESNMIVQAATRDEAYEAETVQPMDAADVCAVSNRYASSKSQQRNRKRLSERDSELPEKRRQQDHARGRRSRCSKCDLMSHRSGTCPALQRNCNNCGKRGHFAAACRKRRINAIQYKREDPETSSSADETPKEVKQVLK